MSNFTHTGCERGGTPDQLYCVDNFQNLYKYLFVSGQFIFRRVTTVPFVFALATGFQITFSNLLKFASCFQNPRCLLVIL